MKSALLRRLPWFRPPAKRALVLAGGGVIGGMYEVGALAALDDLVEALIRLMSADDVYEPVNLGNPGEFTIKELADEVVKICGSNSGLEYLPLPQDDPKQRKPDISRAQTLLNWSPSIPLDEGLRKTVAYFRDRVQTATGTQRTASSAKK